MEYPPPHTYIEYGDSHYVLKEPITIDIISHNDNGYSINYESLDIYIYENSYDNAIDSFKDDFNALWFNYVCEDEENLASDAITLRHKLLDLVAEVKPIL